ncbi:MAG: polysaccharide biosynthesis protein [Fibrobacterota bacterium]
MTKRLFDLGCTTTGLLVLSPLLVLVALIVKLTSRGPVFFRQARVGKDGRPFRIFKFRTMVNDAHKGPEVTARDDGRVTSVGRILRQAKLDELPQLLNVLAGSMSLVGPRPEIPALVAHYTPEQRQLLTVRPGITSPATIYHRDEEEIVGTPEEVMEYHRTVLVPKKAQYDLGYIEHRSFWFDLKLIFLTLLSVLTNESGYMREKAIKNRRAIIVATVLALLALSYFLAYLVRFEWDIPYFYLGKFKRTLPLVLIVKFVFLAYFSQFEGYWRYVSLSDIGAIFKALFLSLLALWGIKLFFLSSFPSGTLLIDFAFSLMLLSGQRLSLRFLREAYMPIVPKSRDKVLVLGAGDRAESVLREIRNNPDMAFNIIGLVDDSPAKMGIKIHGKEVVGTFDDLPSLVEEKGVTVLINTIEPLTQRHSAVLTKLRAQFKCSIRNVPSASDYITGRVNTKRIREIGIEDLLGRKSVELDRKTIEHEFKGRTVLVTGAGGSIGSELVRQILRFEPGRVLLFDKDETLLYELETELKETHPGVACEVLMGDIRNPTTLQRFFSEYRPQVVLHSAAYKHVPLMEQHPSEAVYNNVFGTRNVLTAARDNGIERFVMISTDKAVRPTNVMGATKRLSEMLMFKGFAGRSALKCMAVRFGNVLGSRGSVIPLFTRQINRGGPVRITHPDITRFFMSIPEAAQLVLQAGAMGQGGEIFILKMGEPVLIKDLAERLIEFSGYQPGIDIDIEYMGLRPGEKLHEELLTEIEGTKTTSHDKIMVIDNRQLPDPQLMEQLESLENEGLNDKTPNQIKKILQGFVPEYAPQIT